jgi:hypothetical protein
MKWTGIYAQKVISLHALAQEAGTTVGRLCGAYSEEKVGDDLSKADLFKSATTASYTRRQALYILEACDLTHNRDNRTQLQYATDLILGWLCEDSVVKILNNKGIMANHAGSDKDRNFLQQEAITHGADIETPELSIELLFDFTNHWQQHDKLDLRDNKYKHIVENKIHLLGIAPRTMTAVHIRPDEMPEFKYGEIPAYGKNGYTLKPMRHHLKKLSEILTQKF